LRSRGDVGKHSLPARAPAFGCLLRLKVAAPGTPDPMLLPRNLLALIYVAIGIFVAASKDYLDNLETVKRVLSAILAILLWPLLLLGIDLHIT
jgi:hypothetical protein